MCFGVYYIMVVQIGPFSIDVTVHSRFHQLYLHGNTNVKQV